MSVRSCNNLLILKGISVLFLVFIIVFKAVGQDVPEKMNCSKVPDEVRESFKLAYPKLCLCSWKKEADLYNARIWFSKGKEEVVFDRNGEWIKTCRTILEVKLPLQAHQFIQEKFGAYRVSVCTYEENADGKPYYWVDMALKSNRKLRSSLQFDLSGVILSIDGLYVKDPEDIDPREDLLLAQKSQHKEREEKEIQQRESHMKEQVVQAEAPQEPQEPQVPQMPQVKESVQQEPQEPQEPQTPQDLLAKGQEEKPREKQHKEKRLKEKQAKEQAQEQEQEQVQVQEQVQAQAQKQKPQRTQEPKQEKEPTISIMVDPTEEMSDKSETIAKKSEKKDKSVEIIRETEKNIKSQFALDPTTGYKAPKEKKKKKEEEAAIPDGGEKVKDAFTHRFPRAEKIRWHKDGDNFRVRFDNYEQALGALFKEDGTHIYTEYIFHSKDVPLPIQRHLNDLNIKYKFIEGKRVVHESKYRRSFPAESRPKDYYQVVIGEKIPKQKVLKYTLIKFDYSARFQSQQDNYEYRGE